MSRKALTKNPDVGILPLFDQQPLEIEGFRFRSKSVVAVGRPSEEQWQAAYRFAEACQEGSPYWIGDLLTYAESRQEWASRIDQIQSVVDLDRKTLVNRGYVARHVTGEARALSPSLGHSDVVASLVEPEQVAWLRRAKDEGWSVSEFRSVVRAAKRRRVLDGQAVLEGQYRVLYADPPWQYSDSGATKDGSLGKAERHYPTMTMEQIAAMPVASHALPNSVLFLWVTAPMLYEHPGPRDILEAWGFRYKSQMVWSKVLGMPGRFFQVVHENLIVAERGSCPPDNPVPKAPSVYTERRTGEHSEKPKAVRLMIEKMYDTGPYLELFARSRAENWDVYGNDVRLGEES